MYLHVIVKHTYWSSAYNLYLSLCHFFMNNKLILFAFYSIVESDDDNNIISGLMSQTDEINYSNIKLQ